MHRVLSVEASLLYFAYGSNLYSPRLRWRVPSCELISTATLAGHRLAFHKLSTDKSTKCDAYADQGHSVIGVVYRIAEEELASLRKAEGLGHGYDEHEIAVTIPTGETLTVLTYLAARTHIVGGLAPYSWYWDFVMMGCREQELPTSYIDAYITAVAAVKDPDSEREARARSEVRGNPLRQI